MADTHSDALVFFGATGDLAYKKIFPALQAMARRGELDVPVIGVAKAGWTLDQLRARAQESVEKYGGLDRAAFADLSGRASATSTATTGIRRPSRRFGARSAAPPTLRTTSRFRRRCSGPSSNSSRNQDAHEGPGSSSRNRSARTSSRRAAESDSARHASSSATSSASITTWASAPFTTCCSSVSRTRFVEAFWNRHARRERADHDG